MRVIASNWTGDDWLGVLAVIIVTIASTWLAGWIIRRYDP
jgi:uncharacterized membrane protein AbrB (regulator of aidB expression)